jgi:hypothetical protein
VSSQLPAPVSIETAAPDTPAVDTPPRAVWTSTPPTTLWCPDEWREHLEAVAPGLVVPVDVDDTSSDAVGERLVAQPWHLLLASRRGRLHAHRGEHREDAGSITATPLGWCAAVADGAGSAPYSRLGAAIATQAFTRSVQAALSADTSESATTAQDTLTSAMQHAATASNAAMRDFAERTGLAHRDLRTTLLAAALHGDTLALMQVGDGAMALRHADGRMSHPHAAATGDYSGEVAHFLPDDGALEQLQQSLVVQQRADCVGLVLATDGVEDPWYPFTRHAGTLFSQLASGSNEADVLPTGLTSAWQDRVLHASDPVQALTAWLGFEKRGENDDRTLCVIWHEQAA